MTIQFNNKNDMWDFVDAFLLTNYSDNNRTFILVLHEQELTDSQREALNNTFFGKITQ